MKILDKIFHRHAEGGKKELSNNDIIRALREEGYFPTKNDDQVMFKINGISFVTGIINNDFVYVRTYYRLDGEHKDEFLRAANAVMRSLVAAKVIILDDNCLVFSVESYIGPEQYKDFVQVAVSIVNDATALLNDELVRMQTETGAVLQNEKIATNADRVLS